MDEKIDELIAAREDARRRAVAVHKLAQADPAYAATGLLVLWVGLSDDGDAILATPDRATALDYAGGQQSMARRWLCLPQEDGSVRLLCKVRDVVTARLGVPTPLPPLDPEPLASEEA